MIIRKVTNCNTKTVGDSPACAFLSWRLSTVGCFIIPVESNCLDSETNSINWSSKRFNNDKSFSPAEYFHKSSDLLKLESKNIDFVLICANDHNTLGKYAEDLKDVIKNDTIIIIDSSLGIRLESILQSIFIKNIVLSVVCEANVRIINSNQKNIYAHVGNKVNTVIGSTLSKPSSQILDINGGKGPMSKKLISFVEKLKASGVFPCSIVQEGMSPNLNSYSWKKIIPFVNFEVLSLIYGQLDVSDINYSSVIKGCFYNLLEVAYSSGAVELPEPKNLVGADQYFDQLVKEYNLLYSNHQIKGGKKSSNVAISEFLDKPNCIYNFENHFNTYISLCLVQLIKVAESLKIKIPVIECLYSFYLEIEKIAKDHKFDWIKKQPTHDVQNNQRQISQNSNGSYSANVISNEPFSPITLPPTSYVFPATDSAHNQYLPSACYPQNKIGEQLMATSAAVLGSSLTVPYQNSSQYYTSIQAQHPRFTNLPEESSGKQISYLQIKKGMYRNTSVGASVNDLNRAHKFLYDHGNLNKTFETINNRYGEVDSLSRFKATGKNLKYIEEMQDFKGQEDKINGIKDNDNDLEPE